ncbi:MAG TPA: PDZ domain-containing protein [Gemmataceae bacterium]|nr:PDZ domain-containing protein [Gemmataceae bacterium]
MIYQSKNLMALGLAVAFALGGADVALAQAQAQLPQMVPGGRNPIYKLGVYYENTESGARITSVIVNSPAWRLGLEQGDYIVRVDGKRIGIVNGYVYPLPNELQRSNGTVELLIWNRRTRNYETHVVTLSTQ